MSDYENALLQDFESDEDIDIQDAAPVPEDAGAFLTLQPLFPLENDPLGTNSGNARGTHEPNGGFPPKTNVNAAETPLLDPASETNPGSPDSGESTTSIVQKLLQNRNSSLSVGSRLHQIDAMTRMPVSALLSVLGVIPEIRRELSLADDATDYHELLAHVMQLEESDEYRFLVSLSALPALVQEEMALLHRYVCVQYQVIFPELETLVPSAFTYCAVVLEIGQDLAGIRAHEAGLKSHVTPEKVLTIVMAALQQHSRLFTLSDDDMANISAASEACMQLHGFSREIGDFLARKLAHFAPNVSELVGSVACSQLLMSCGSLASLALTPACNLAALGVRENLAQNSAKSTGYLFQSPVLQGLPPEIVRLAQRVLAAKVVLAARVDLARSCTEGEMGKKYLLQVQGQIDRLLTPPERVKTKALPVPQEQKSKKRAGRRFRKMRERFQMSELRKAQNKVQFGKEEDHVIDGYGEEVGLGMSRQSDSVSVNRNTDARMSKAMVNRLNQKKEQETLDTIVLAPVVEKRTVQDDWGAMKKRRVEQ